MLKFYKKSQGMPVNVIIIAALALIVLVVLVAVFTGRARIFSQSLESCAAKQGECYENRCPDNTALVTNTNCPEGYPNKNKKLCCVQVFSA